MALQSEDFLNAVMGQATKEPNVVFSKLWDKFFIDIFVRYWSDKIKFYIILFLYNVYINLRIKHFHILTDIIGSKWILYKL